MIIWQTSRRRGYIGQKLRKRMFLNRLAHYNECIHLCQLRYGCMVCDGEKRPAVEYPPADRAMMLLAAGQTPAPLDALILGVSISIS